MKTYKSMEDVPMFMTVMDMAALLGVSRASAYELVKEKGFPKLNVVHGRIIFRETDSSNGWTAERKTERLSECKNITAITKEKTVVRQGTTF